MKDTALPIFVTILVIVASFSCDESAGPNRIDTSAYQMPGCQGQLLKSGQTDSCFSYDFHDRLIVDFCATGNCCPDSNRFRLQCTVSGDTIHMAVADTAAHLCNCMCPYRIHLEIPDLPGESCLFLCTREDSSDRFVIYAEHIHRHGRILDVAGEP